MRRQRVNSSSLESVGFDPVTNQLEIQFRAGGVSSTRFRVGSNRELMEASSLGAFFARRIRHAYRDGRWTSDRRRAHGDTSAPRVVATTLGTVPATPWSPSGVPSLAVTLFVPVEGAAPGGPAS